MRLSTFKFLLKVLLTITVLFVTIYIYKGFTRTEKAYKVINPVEEIAESKYIISEEAILSKLKFKSQIVSMQQTINKLYTDIDDKWNGKRYTELHINGTYKMGLNASDIEVKHIDSDKGIVYIKLGQPKLISLEIPYDVITFAKTKGFFRADMSEDEKKKFYKVVEKDLRNEIVNDKEIMKQANLYNQEMIEGLMKDVAGIDHISFE